MIKKCRVAQFMSLSPTARLLQVQGCYYAMVVNFVCWISGKCHLDMFSWIESCLQETIRGSQEEDVNK